MIGILNIGMGNLRSVSNAVYNLGYDFTIVKESNHLDNISHLVIPGVGSFSAAVQNLLSFNLQKDIQDYTKSGKPILGLCLGMHILAEYGEEGGATKGLGLLNGRVIRMPDKNGLRLPHVGWNTVKFKVDHPVFHRVKNGVDFYFVHSYQFACEYPDLILAETDYGNIFPSIVGKENILGFQFHPEKSQVNGLELLENFCEWDGKW